MPSNNLEYHVSTTEERRDALIRIAYKIKPRLRKSAEIKSYSDLVPKLIESGENFKEEFITEYFRLLCYSEKGLDFPNYVKWKNFSPEDFKGWPIEGPLTHFKARTPEDRQKINKIISNLDNIELEETFFQKLYQKTEKTEQTRKTVKELRYEIEGKIN